MQSAKNYFIENPYKNEKTLNSEDDENSFFFTDLSRLIKVFECCFGLKKKEMKVLEFHYVNC